MEVMSELATLYRQLVMISIVLFLYRACRSGTAASDGTVASTSAIPVSQIGACTGPIELQSTSCENLGR
jgi:hypothetical protein